MRFDKTHAQSEPGRTLCGATVRSYLISRDPTTVDCLRCLRSPRFRKSIGSIPACRVCHVWPGHDIPTHVQSVKDEISQMIADGELPPTITTFSEVHDYTDANMLDGLGGSIEMLAGEDDPEGQQAEADTFNLITDEVAAWLAVGRVDAPLTPERAARALARYLDAHFPFIDAYADGTAVVAESTIVRATPDGWVMVEGVREDETEVTSPMTTKGKIPLALGDIYLVAWAMSEAGGVRRAYQHLEV